MASETLRIDENDKNTVGFVTDDANQFIRNARIDDATKGLKVMLVGGATQAITGLITAGTNITITGSGTSLSPYIITSTAASTPGGSNTQVQYNNNGALAGSSSFTFDGTTMRVENFDTVLSADMFTGVDIGDQINTAYAYVVAQGLKGAIVTLPGTVYTYSTPIVMATNGVRISVKGAPGQGTELKYTGTGAGATVNCSIPASGVSHTSWEVFQGITFTGNNTSTTSPQIGVLLGGSIGASGAILNQVNIHGFGYGYNTDANTYHTMYMNSSVWNCGKNILVNSAANAGEEIQFLNVFCVDGASNTPDDCFDIQGASSVIITGGSIDDGQIRMRGSVLSLTINGVHFENPNSTAYGAYTYIIADSNANASLIINGGTMMNDGSGANAPAQFINTGVPTTITGTAFYRNGSAATVASVVTFNASTGSLVWNNAVNENSAYTDLVGSITASPMGYMNQAGSKFYTDASGFLFLGGASTSGTISASNFANNIANANALVATSTTGTTISRNIADTNAALKINQINASSTGDILDLQFGGTTLAKVDKSGILTSPSVINPTNPISAVSNAATVPVTSRINTVTNNSAAALTITLATSGAVDKQLCEVCILDFSGVAQTITWVNTENSTITAPTTSNGSTTLPLSIGFQYNGLTSKWRCIAVA